MLCLSYSLWYVDCLMILTGVVDTNLNHMITATQRSVIRIQITFPAEGM